jgi:Tify domain binding domain
VISTGNRISYGTKLTLVLFKLRFSMSPLDREEARDEPNASKSIEREGKGKSIEDKLPLDPVSMSKGYEITPNGSKRKRKDWRAFYSENGGARRRFLRSDMAKLLAETEARAAKGAGTRFNLAELEGKDWVKCGDDLQITNGNVGQINEKLNDESNEGDVALVTGKELTNMGQTKHLGNGKLGAGERKVGDFAAASGIEKSYFSSGKEVEKLLVTKDKEGMKLLDVTQLEGTDDDGHEEALEGNGKGDNEDQLAAHAVSDKIDDKNIQCETGKVDASCGNSKGTIEIENSQVKEEPADIEGKHMKTGDNQFNILKKAKNKLSAANKRTDVKVESDNMERRFTRSSAAKQKVNDENTPVTEGATVVQGQMEEESSGLDQIDTDDNELLKNIKLKTNKKPRSDWRKCSNVTDSDEDFNPARKKVRKKQAKVEPARDGSVSLGTKRESSMKRSKVKMEKQNPKEDFKVIKRDQQKRHTMESVESDSSGYQMERHRKKKEPKNEREDSSSSSDFLGSDEGTPAMKKRQGRSLGFKHKTGKANISKMIREKKKQALPLNSKNKEKVIKVESLSELNNKPRKIAKEIVSNMIKDLLKEHGWNIEMRPRNGRDYFDQVHVSPDGTTHWSITKAYYGFLQERESLRSQSMGKGKEVVDFTPIPEELLDLLKRTVCKERCDKQTNKLKGNKKHKGKWFAVKSKKIKKKIKKERVKSTNSDINDMDVGLKLNPGRNQKKKARLTLLARGSHKEGDTSGENDYVPYEWKRTVLSWMIDLDVVSENGKVKYIEPEKPDPLAEGKISRDGIQCDCCGKCFTVSGFGVHVGAKNGSSCLSNLFMEDAGFHFMQCLVQAWEKQWSISKPKGFFLSSEAEGVDQNDDTCGVCGDGGDLVCCDKCPSTFHLGCLGMEMLPSGDWHCPYCSCAFCMKLSSFPLLSCNQCNDKCKSY